jgi:type I restriction enzyme S subunit
MSRYKAYLEYKDSGVEWVGMIPSSWEVAPLFSLASTDVVKNDDGAESNVLSLSYGRIVRRDVEDNHGLLPESFNTYQLVEPGDIILRLTDLQNDKRSLRVGLANEKGIITSAYLKLTAKKKKFLDHYLYRLLHSYDTTKVFYGMGGGLRQSMKFEEMRRLQMLCPSLEEQERIAAFLDHETAKIDALIEKQQRLIELLKEKRQAVISHAVTKGLNPNAPMKDSGVEWLGEVPAHWEIKKFNRCTSIKSGQVDPTKPPFSGFTLIAPNHIESGTGKIISLETAEDQGADSGKYLCSEGEVIYSKIRPALAKVCISPSNETICSADMYPISAIGGLLNSFLYWSLLSGWFTSFVILESDRVAMPKINREKLAEIFLPIPPEIEQINIAKELKKQTCTIDALLEKAVGGIELLQERRTALISAAVTGKIDVRDWQAAA